MPTQATDDVDIDGIGESGEFMDSSCVVVHAIHWVNFSRDLEIQCLCVEPLCLGLGLGQLSVNTSLTTLTLLLSHNDNSSQGSVSTR